MSAASAKTEKACCRVCGCADLKPLRPSTIHQELSAGSFKISDSDYGRCGRLDQCPDCGFIQCTDMDDVLGYYEALEDPEYVESREQRALQERALLGLLRPHQPGGRLLDVGAGMGTLVEEALEAGYRAEGVEPSRWLCDQARTRKVPVRCGTLPHPDLAGPYDAVTVIDVIEHTPDPVGLLKDIRSLLTEEGRGLVTTPDASSLAARLLGRRWWHYRIAHINYFNRKTLLRALDEAGLEPVEISRPKWYFSLAYLLERVGTYVPIPSFLVQASISRTIIPVNLFDSLAVVFKRKVDRG